MSSKEYVELWNSIHENRHFTEQGWYQEVPHDSLKFFEEYKIPKDAGILEVGGGESLMVDHLLDKGYEDITVLDISPIAIAKTKKRLGERAVKVNWVISDITEFQPRRKYDVWHDRATLHFLLTEVEIEKYIRLLKSCANDNLRVMLATFSDRGASKCSGIPVRQYSLEYLSSLLEPEFNFSFAYSPIHLTPTGIRQNYSIAWFG